MLHFFVPSAPVGQDGSDCISRVHVCEHTLWPRLSMLLVQGLLMHSLEVSETVVHVAPNVPDAGPEASGAGAGELLEQAHSARDRASTRRCMVVDVTAARPSIAGCSCDLDVTALDRAITGPVTGRVIP